MGVFSNNHHGLTDQQKKRLKELTLNQYEWKLIELSRNILETFSWYNSCFIRSNLSTYGFALLYWSSFNTFSWINIEQWYTCHRFKEKSSVLIQHSIQIEITSKPNGNIDRKEGFLLDYGRFYKYRFLNLFLCCK